MTCLRRTKQNPSLSYIAARERKGSKTGRNVTCCYVEKVTYSNEHSFLMQGSHINSFQAMFSLQSKGRV